MFKVIVYVVILVKALIKVVNLICRFINPFNLNTTQILLTSGNLLDQDTKEFI